MGCRDAISEGDVILLDLGLLPPLELYQLISLQIQSGGRMELSQNMSPGIVEAVALGKRVRLQPLWPISVFSFTGDKAVLPSLCRKKRTPYLQMVVSFKNTNFCVFRSTSSVIPLALNF